MVDGYMGSQIYFVTQCLYNRALGIYEGLHIAKQRQAEARNSIVIAHNLKNGSNGSAMEWSLTKRIKEHISSDSCFPES
jgi:hypothetical protein